MARFSICTSFFNDDASRARSLYESLLRQDADWEWVVTDDFSEDPSAKDMLLSIAAADPRVRYAHQDHKMQMLRNPATFASGEFVFHIDSDDLVYPGYLPLCQRLFDRFPDVGVILCNGHVVDQKGSFVRYQEHMPIERRAGVHPGNSGSVCFLGRCWRRSIEIDFSGIIEDRFFTTTNDFYLVKYLNTKTRMLVVPRNMIRYEQFVDESRRYRPFGSRGIEIGEDLSASHERGYGQFMKYYEAAKKPLDGLFPYYESIPNLYMPLYPTHMLSSDRIRLVGFDATECEKAMLEDLYAEKSISWGDSYEEGALNILNSEKKIEVDASFSILAYFAPMRHENIEHYRRGFQSHGFISQSGSVWLFR